jgi:hypothetical protein
VTDVPCMSAQRLHMPATNKTCSKFMLRPRRVRQAVGSEPSTRSSEPVVSDSSRVPPERPRLYWWGPAKTGSELTPPSFSTPYRRPSRPIKSYRSTKSIYLERALKLEEKDIQIQLKQYTCLISRGYNDPALPLHGDNLHGDGFISWSTIKTHCPSSASAAHHV